ncbi:MAG: FkbM family methyltransferase [Solirubrobacteraceae bacterium]|nr:FkbM family methyltransferase [Solirubrobacteraceae bacterium]
MSHRSLSLSPGEAVSAAKRGLHAARSSYTQRRGRADHIGMAVALRAALSPGDDAIDVGAHLGDVTRQILQSTIDGRVLAIEPLPHLAADLRRTLVDSVIVEECALTDGEPGEAEFLHVKNNPGYSGLRERDYPEEPDFEKVTVKTQRLDDLVAKHGIKPRLIKIDVEGAELLVLRGAQQTITEFKPLILIEHGSAASGYGESPATFFDCVTELGLRVFNFDGDAPYQRGAFINAVGPNHYFNFLLRP